MRDVSTAFRPEDPAQGPAGGAARRRNGTWVALGEHGSGHRQGEV